MSHFRSRPSADQTAEVNRPHQCSMAQNWKSKFKIKYTGRSDKQLLRFKHVPLPTPELKYSLVAWPNGLKETWHHGSELSACLYVKMLFESTEPKKEFTVKYEVSILKDDKEKLHRQECQTNVPNNMENSSSVITLSLSEVKNDLRTGGILTVYVEILELICDGIQLFPLPTGIKSNNEKLVEDLAGLLESEEFSDIILVAGKTEFKAHKAILVARSPVFGAMLKAHTKESQESRIEMGDMSAESCQELLRYIYSSKVNSIELKKHALELLPLADKYDLSNLRMACVDVLSKEITLQTVAVIFRLADLHLVNDLRAKCLSFMLENAEEVGNTESWNILIKQCPEYASELFQQLAQAHSSLKRSHSEAFSKKTRKEAQPRDRLYVRGMRQEYRTAAPQEYMHYRNGN